MSKKTASIILSNFKGFRWKIQILQTLSKRFDLSSKQCEFFFVKCGHGPSDIVILQIRYVVEDPVGEDTVLSRSIPEQLVKI